MAHGHLRKAAGAVVAAWAALAMGVAVAQQVPLGAGSGWSQADEDGESSQWQNAESAATAGRTDAETNGPVRLRQRAPAARQEPDRPGAAERETVRVRAYEPSEFERYVQQRAAQDAGAEARPRRPGEPREQPIRRFGAQLVFDDTTSAAQSATQDPLPTVPGDYVIQPGDEVRLTVWGSVDADLRLPVDRSGRITVPRAGAIEVAGLRQAELAGAISRRLGQVFRNFQLVATLGRPRAVRVFVTGYALRPGSLTVSGLSSVLHVLAKAGGPSAAGSFRDIQLIRDGRVAGRFDLYGLLLKGDRGADQLVQPDDVIHVGPVGTQVGVIGSVNQPAVYELKPGEVLDDALRMAGGLNAVADRGRVVVERVDDRVAGRITEIALPAGQSAALGSGDVVRALSAIQVALPKERQNKRVRVEGEVVRPGDYVLPPESTLADALRAAGGMTPAAHLFGTEFTRESVRRTQQQNYERALRDLEVDIAKRQASQRTATSEEVAAATASSNAGSRLIDRLREIRPNGRIVLQITPESTALPELALEDGDRISIPPHGTSVGVFGSVFNAGSFLFTPGRTAQDYLRLAGGPTRGADEGSAFLIRANGSVVSARQGASVWSRRGAFNDTVVQPGDTVFVPEEMNRTTFVQDAKDWTQILYQFGLGMAGLRTLGR